MVDQAIHEHTEKRYLAKSGSDQPNSPEGMKQRARAFRLARGLALIGLLLSFWQLSKDVEHQPLQGDRLWELQLVVDAEVEAGKSVLTLLPPSPTASLKVVGQSLSYTGWRQIFQSANPGSKRSIRLLATEPSPDSVIANFSIHQHAVASLGGRAEAASFTESQRALYLQDHPILQITSAEVEQRAAQLIAEASETQDAAARLFRYVESLPKAFVERTLPVDELLRDARVTVFERGYTLVALARAAGIPARVVRGVMLEPKADVRMHYWVELLLDDVWQSYDPSFGYLREVPANYLPLGRSLLDVVRISDGQIKSRQISIENQDELLELPDESSDSVWQVWDFAGLSLDTRLLLSTLFLMPLGVLVTALATELVGVRLYGVFTPTLLAASWVYVPWQAALVILATVLIVGVLGRALMPSDLARQIRLAVVVTFVCLGVAISASLMEHFELLFGGQLALLPVVVLVNLVDRFYAQLDEHHVRSAIYRLAWTLLVSLICLPILIYEALGHALVEHPHWHLFTLAALILLSLYRGRRASQLPGLSWLAWGDKRAS